MTAGHTGFEGMYCGYVVTEECQSSPCLNGGTCSDGLQMYTCQCNVPTGLESLILDGNCDSRTGPIFESSFFSEPRTGPSTPPPSHPRP